MKRIVPGIGSLVFGCLLVLSGTTQQARAEPEIPPIGSGDLRTLSALPEKVLLRSAVEVQQLVITGHYANGGVRDLTRQVTFRALDPRVVRVAAGGLVEAGKNGVTEVIAEWQGHTVKVKVTVKGADRQQSLNFTNEIVPLFSKLGCNSGACHGKSTGQNGFRLSLLGFEPQIDYEALAREGRGRRVMPSAPEASLLLRKPTGDMPHGGGRRLDPGARDYQTLLRWIRAGMPFGQDTDPRVAGLVVAPGQRLVPPKSQQQITVTALLSDGTRRDVTADAEYSSNNPELVSVSPGGLIDTQDIPGEGAIMVRYLGHVGVFRATIPQDAPLHKYPWPQPANFIDEQVVARLKQLGLPPSELCSDSEFLRRVSIDITGTLPTAAEAEKFLADTDPGKRAKLVEHLLDRPAYASYFALKWGDILRNRRDGLVGVGGKQVRTSAFHAWILESLGKNQPYDQFVRAILTAQGDFAGPQAQPPVGWYNVLRTPTALADDTAQVFLGTRIQCAQCHHHPYEKWSQDDYWGLAAFFARVQLVNPKNPVQPKKANAKPGANDTRVVLAAEGRLTSPQGKGYARPRLLAGEELDLPASEDPRQKLVDWMVHPDNPFFARALVNRYWAHFFGRGIVEMPDDMRVSNPPSNPALLEALARDFIAHQFDLKHLIRTICTSKTYQLASRPNAHNARDKQNFARFHARRLPAEVLFDAIDQVTGTPPRFVSGKGGAAKTSAGRAIELPDEAVKTPLLVAFGKPERSSACECERSNAATLSQSLYLIGSAELHGKLKNKSGRIAQLAAAPRPVHDKIREIYLWVYARPPDAAELNTVQAYLLAAGGRAAGYEDVFWALVNTKEFLFNH
ncbi:MAG TPA: DUF1549 and DUF1553 domain-containing protein [Gemmataceae bacterium]|nr:DUF1549 and DUF1553 domain-containing protein [Gemmataceae bacterium]